MTATAWASNHGCCLPHDYPDTCACRCHDGQPATDLTDLLAALAPFLRCEAGVKGGTCWPRCDGPERKALAAAVERLQHPDRVD